MVVFHGYVSLPEGSPLNLGSTWPKRGETKEVKSLTGRKCCEHGQINGNNDLKHWHYIFFG